MTFRLYAVIVQHMSVERFGNLTVDGGRTAYNQYCTRFCSCGRG